jgi:hypothetical protein
MIFRKLRRTRPDTENEIPARKINGFAAAPTMPFGNHHQNRGIERCVFIAFIVIKYQFTVLTQ